MNNDSQLPVRHKPAGGVRSAVLLLPSVYGDLFFSADGTSCECIRPQGEVHRCRLADGRSSFDETLEVKGGTRTVTHRLRLVADRDAAEEWLKPDFIQLLRFTGVAADITLADGRRLLAGVSAHMYDKQPLRLRSIDVASGCRLADVPSVTMVLESTDSAFAAALTYNV